MEVIPTQCLTLTLFTFQTPVSGAHRSSQQPSSFGGSRQLFHKEPQPHDLWQCGHCKHHPTHTHTSACQSKVSPARVLANYIFHLMFVRHLRLHQQWKRQTVKATLPGWTKGKWSHSTKVSCPQTFKQELTCCFRLDASSVLLNMMNIPDCHIVLSLCNCHHSRYLFS